MAAFAVVISWRLCFVIFNAVAPIVWGVPMGPVLSVRYLILL